MNVLWKFVTPVQVTVTTNGGETSVEAVRLQWSHDGQFYLVRLTGTGTRPSLSIELDPDQTP